MLSVVSELIFGSPFCWFRERFCSGYTVSALGRDEPLWLALNVNGDMLSVPVDKSENGSAVSGCKEECLNEKLMQ